jgi:hypothetical protein
VIFRFTFLFFALYVYLCYKVTYNSTPRKYPVRMHILSMSNIYKPNIKANQILKGKYPYLVCLYVCIHFGSYNHIPRCFLGCRPWHNGDNGRTWAT